MVLYDRKKIEALLTMVLISVFMGAMDGREDSKKYCALSKMHTMCRFKVSAFIRLYVFFSVCVNYYKEVFIVPRTRF